MCGARLSLAVIFGFKFLLGQLQGLLKPFIEIFIVSITRYFFRFILIIGAVFVFFVCDCCIFRGLGAPKQEA